MNNTHALPLFPLNVVVCPNGYLPLKIFETRYLDMVRSCLRHKTGFAIVTVLPEGESYPEGNLPFSQIGTLVDIIEADVTTAGLMMIRCVGQRRIHVNSFSQQADGLIVGQVSALLNDLDMLIPDDLKSTGDHLKHVIEALKEQGVPSGDMPILEPYQFENATWVSNRWVELLDLSLLQKYRLMTLESPILRLELVNDILEDKSQNYP